MKNDVETFGSLPPHSGMREQIRRAKTVCAGARLPGEATPLARLLDELSSPLFAIPALTSSGEPAPRRNRNQTVLGLQPSARSDSRSEMKNARMAFFNKLKLLDTGGVHEHGT